MAGIKLDIKDPNNPSETLNFYIDDKLKDKLEHKLIPEVSKKDEDAVLIVDGNERTGKSVFAMQLGKFLDHDLDLKRICFTAEEFKNAVLNAQKNQCIIFDEGYRGLAGRQALSEVNRVLITLMMEMGQKNLYIIVVLPTFYMLDRYPAIFRARGLFHIYKKKGAKGFWRFYNKKKKAELYNNIKLKKAYSYPKTSRFRGRFYNKYVVNEVEYRKKKEDSFKKLERGIKSEKYIKQRDNLLYLVYKHFNISLQELAELCQKYKITLKKAAVHHIIKRIEDEKIDDVSIEN